jgi:hypothetical protein
LRYSCIRKGIWVFRRQVLQLLCTEVQLRLQRSGFVKTVAAERFGRVLVDSRTLQEIIRNLGVMSELMPLPGDLDADDRCGDDGPTYRAGPGSQSFAECGVSTCGPISFPTAA